MLHIIGKLMNTQQQERFTTVAAALQDACRKSGKSMGAIAMQAGFTSTREWEKIVNGHVRLDGMRIAAIAATLGTDPIELGRVLVADYWPDFLELFDAIPIEVLKGDMSSIPASDHNPICNCFGVLHEKE